MPAVLIGVAINSCCNLELITASGLLLLILRGWRKKMASDNCNCKWKWWVFTRKRDKWILSGHILQHAQIRMRKKSMCVRQVRSYCSWRCKGAETVSVFSANAAESQNGKRKSLLAAWSLWWDITLSSLVILPLLLVFSFIPSLSKVSPQLNDHYKDKQSMTWKHVYDSMSVQSDTIYNVPQKLRSKT